MENYRPAIGTPIQDLDTPCLMVDLDALEHNFDVIAETYRDTVCKLREHGKNIKSPVMGRMQIEAGGTVGGVCCAKASEAEVMVEGGITNILVTNQVVTRDKIARLCGLAKRADIKVAVDNPSNLLGLSEVADAHDATLGIVIEVDTSMSRGGIRSIAEGVQLAKQSVALPGLAFRGVMSHQTLGGKPPDRENRFIEGRRYIQMCLDVKDAIEAEGIPVGDRLLWRDVDDRRGADDTGRNRGPGRHLRPDGPAQCDGWGFRGCWPRPGERSQHAAPRHGNRGRRLPGHERPWRARPSGCPRGQRRVTARGARRPQVGGPDAVEARRQAHAAAWPPGHDGQSLGPLHGGARWPG